MPLNLYSIGHSDEHPLTTYLCSKWQQKRQQNWRHTPKPHVEENTQLERNIISDLPFKVAPTIKIHISRRGDRNIPKRYLKDAEWNDDPSREHAPGYFATSLEEPEKLVPVEFDRQALQWGLAIPHKDGGYIIDRPAPITYKLRIYDGERAERSQWGPIDGQEEDKDTFAPDFESKPPFQFGSDQGDSPDPDVDIPAQEREAEELALASLAQLIPSYITKPYIDTLDTSPLLVATMSQIAATTTIAPTSTLARTAGAGVPMGSLTGPAHFIRERLRGGGSGKPPQKPRSGNPDGSGGGDPDGAGGGGDPIGGHPDPGEPHHRTNDKLMGKEPDIFDGSCDKVEGFLTVWNVYRSLNRWTTTMGTAFDRTMLFLGYIQGPKVDEWVKDQIGIVLNHLEGGGQYADEWIWDTVVNEFA